MALQKPTETLTRDNLFSALQLMPVVTGTITIASGQGKLARGALITETGTLCGKAADSGGEPDPVTPGAADAVYCILADDVDATSGAVEAPCYFTGDFNEAELTFNTANSATVDHFRASARKVGIFFRTNI